MSDQIHEDEVFVWEYEDPDKVRLWYEESKGVVVLFWEPQQENSKGGTPYRVIYERRKEDV